MEYKSLSHCKYLMQYHIIWCPKYRFNILVNEIEKTLKAVLEVICEHYDYEMIELETMPDHIHIFLSAKPTDTPTDIVRKLKSITAKELFKKFPSLKKRYWGGVLWSKGYFISTIGKVSAETIKKYIQEQKTK